MHSLRYEVNCSILFTELPLLQRPAAAKAAGFDAVEFWWPFATAVPADAEVDSFVRAITDAGVALEQGVQELIEQEAAAGGGFRAGQAQLAQSQVDAGGIDLVGGVHAASPRLGAIRS